MEDLGDGRYEAVLPAAWAPNRTGSLTVAFFDAGVEVCPSVLKGVDQAEDYSTTCRSLRTVVYDKAECPAGLHTVPDAGTGATCICRAGYEADTAPNASAALSCYKVCHGNTVGAACDHCAASTYHAAGICRKCPSYALCPGGPFAAAVAAPCPAGRQPDAASERCERCPAGKASLGLARCDPCGADQEPADDGTRCACAPGHYNTSSFGRRSAQCIPQDFRRDAAAARHECAPCDAVASCAACSGGELRRQPGWGLASEAAPWNILRCPLAGACIGLGCIVALY
jgi:hypothetical protein